MSKPKSVVDEHRQRLRAIIERDFGASSMNNTKWAEALAELKPVGLQFRAKLITADEPTGWGLLSSGPEPHLPLGWLEGCVGSSVLTKEMEWLELSTISTIQPGRPYQGKPTDYAVEIEQHLRAAGVPFTCEGTVIRIWGHQRRSSLPET